MLDFVRRREGRSTEGGPSTGEFLRGYSIEVTPRTAARVDDFQALLPVGTRVYVAHIEGTPIGDMVATARRLRSDGFAVMPHLPARMLADAAMLEDWLRRYRDEAGVDEALLLAGGAATPHGAFDSSIAMMETGLFDRFGFTRLHVAGHPEGNRDIDADGTTSGVDSAVMWKQAFSERTDAEMAIVTQFAFDARPVIAWADRLRTLGVRLPVHVGIAGPTRLQTLLKYAVACGVGPSLRVLQKRAMDITKLMLPYEPTEFVAALAAYKVEHPDCLIESAHFFPLGGISASAEWANAKVADAEKLAS